MIRAIVAADPRLAIGRGGALPWRYPADLRFFRERTTGHAVLMGRRTFESIGRALPARRNLVLSTSGFEHPGVETLAGPEALDALELEPGTDLFVIGGAEVYRLLAGRIEEWLVTRIPQVADGADTFLDPALFDGFEKVAELDLGEGLVVETLRRG